jgi:hypothetical protein
MPLDDAIAERLVDEARKRIARNESPALGKAAMVVGTVALMVSPIAIAGWLLGATALGMGLSAIRRAAPPRQARIGIGLGVAAILIGSFFYSLAVTLG